jgi:hypothetical protein
MPASKEQNRKGRTRQNAENLARKSQVRREFAERFKAALELWAKNLPTNIAQQPRLHFAALLGVSKDTINNWRDGTSAPPSERWELVKLKLTDCNDPRLLSDLDRPWKLIRGLEDNENTNPNFSNEISKTRLLVGGRSPTRRVLEKKLVDFAIDLPPQDGKPEDFYVTVLLEFGVSPMHLGDQRALIGVRAAVLL